MDMAPPPKGNEYAAAARSRTLGRLLWSAQAEGLSIEAPANDGRPLDSFAAALEAVRSAIESSCAEHSWTFDKASWQKFVGEIDNSLRNETLAIEWREEVWKPSLLQQSKQHSATSLWALSGNLSAASEEAQLLWEISASFNGHMTHPCAKTKLELSPSELQRVSPEFGPVVPLVVGALAASAAQQFATPGCGAPTAATYFALKFPQAYAQWTLWIERAAAGHGVAAWIPLPIHPANLQHVREDFAELVATNLLLVPEGSPAGDDEAGAPVALIGAPLMSCRTLLPLAGGGGGGAGGCGSHGGIGSGSGAEGASNELSAAAPYLKMPVPVQMTSLRRYLSPVEANGGPHISQMLLEILGRDAAIAARLRVLAEECSVHVHHPSVSYERARYLSCLYRANAATQMREACSAVPKAGGAARCLPLAALLATDPITSRPVLLDVLSAYAKARGKVPTSAAGGTAAGAAASSSSSRSSPPSKAGRGSGGASGVAVDAASALDWYSGVCDVVLGSALRLWVCYGVTLELHQQNTLYVLGADGRLASVMCREVAGGAYCFEPLLQANGFDLRGSLHPRQDAIFDAHALPLSILLHAVFCQHLLVLAEAVASLVDEEEPGAEGSGDGGGDNGEGPLRPRLVAKLRSTIGSTLRTCSSEHAPRLLEGAGHRDAFETVLEATDHALLLSPTMRAKGLLHMRALATKSELFTSARNPLLAHSGGAPGGGGGQQDHVSARLGRLEGFPLPWRKLDKVTGIGAAWSQHI